MEIKLTLRKLLGKLGECFIWVFGVIPLMIGIAVFLFLPVYTIIYTQKFAFKIKCVFKPEQKHSFKKISKLAKSEFKELKKLPKEDLLMPDRIIFQKAVNIDDWKGYIKAYSENVFWDGPEYNWISVEFDLRMFNFIGNLESEENNFFRFKIFKDGRIEDFIFEN